MSPPVPQNSTRSRRHLLLVIPIVLALGGLLTLFFRIRSIELKPADGSEGYKIWLHPTQGEQAASIRENLLKSIQSLSIEGPTARFRILPDARFGIGGGYRDPVGNVIRTEFVLSAPDEQIELSEYHGGTVFKVKQITTDAVVLSYLHTFSGYNGHGGQLVRQDVGEITLTPFRN